MIETRITAVRSTRLYFPLGAGTLYLAITLLFGVATESGADRWVVTGCCTAVLGGAVLWWVHRHSGETVLTAEGMRLRTVLRRRQIPWSAVIAIEEDQPGFGRYSDIFVRAYLQGGRSVPLPGAVRISSADHERFTANLETIRAHWYLATGRHDDDLT